jgi:hypothetical protein
MRILAVVGLMAGVAMLLAACGNQPYAAPATSASEQPVVDAAHHAIASSVDPDPRVGAIFFGDSDLHSCTAAVLHSAGGDLVLIGGLHGGGCAENLSYLPPVDEHITDLLARAEAGGPGDAPPAAFNDEC